MRSHCGEKHPSAKPLKGFKGAGVLEVVEDFDGDTYRAIYTLKLAGVVYVLHAFQKKSNYKIYFAIAVRLRRNLKRSHAYIARLLKSKPETGFLVKSWLGYFKPIRETRFLILGNALAIARN